MRLDVLAAAGPVTLPWVWLQDGTPTDVGAVTVTVTDANGTATTGTATITDDNVYEFELPNQPRPGYLRVDWTRDDTGATLTGWVEVNGSVLFTEADARLARPAYGVAALADPDEYPDPVIASARLHVTDLFEHRTGRSWVQRYARAEGRRCGSGVAHLRDLQLRTATGAPLIRPGAYRDVTEVLSLTVNGASVDPADCWIEHDTIIHTAGAGPVVVEWLYGLADPDSEAVDAGLRLIAANLVSGDISAYATSMSTSDGTFRITTYPRVVEEFLHRRDRRIGLA